MIGVDLYKSIIFRLYSLLFYQKKSKAIFYHDIHSDERYTEMSTSIKLFINHINIIRERGYDIVSNISKPNKQVEISFDDGFFGIYQNRDLIRYLDIPVQLFVVSSYIGKDNYINQQQLLKLNSLSQVTISSHTNNHVDLTTVSKKRVKDELQMSKKILEEILNQKIDNVCFPYGRFNYQIIEIAKNVGYTNIYSSLPGFYFDSHILGVTNRSLVQHASKQDFYSILKGGDHILSRWYKRKHFR